MVISTVDTFLDIANKAVFGATCTRWVTFSALFFGVAVRCEATVAVRLALRVRLELD